jgi:hypothetical protein
VSNILSDAEKKEYTKRLNKNVYFFIIVIAGNIMVKNYPMAAIFLVVLIQFMVRGKEEIQLIENGHKANGKIIKRKKFFSNINLKVEIEVEGRIYKNNLSLKKNINKNLNEGDNIEVYYKEKNPRRFTALECVAPERFEKSE